MVMANSGSVVWRLLVVTAAVMLVAAPPSTVSANFYGKRGLSALHLSRGAADAVPNSGVETGRSGGPMNRGPELLGDPSGVTKIFGKKIIGLLLKN